MDYIHTDDAPAAIGPYSQAIRVDGWLYTSGQIGLDPSSGEMVEGFEAQAHQVMANLKAVLGKAGGTFADVVKTTIYLADFEDFQVLNKIYGEAIGDHRPARSTVEVAGLPLGARLEIDMVARLPKA